MTTDPTPIYTPGETPVPRLRPVDSTSSAMPVPDLIGSAAARDRQPSTSVTEEQLQVVKELEELTRVVAEHDRRLMQGLPVDWRDVAERLARAARECRRQVAPLVVDVGDSGGR